MQASIQFVGWNFKDVERWCDFYCIPIISKEYGDNGEVEKFTIRTEQGLLDIYKGDIIQYEQTFEHTEVSKEFFANYE